MPGRKPKVQPTKKRCQSAGGNTKQGRGKLKFHSKEDALTWVMEAGFRGITFRAYKCPFCRYWHLTTNPEWNKPGS